MKASDIREPPCRWAVVGCGWVARDYAIPAILRSPHAELIACCDESDAALEATVKVLHLANAALRMTRHLDDVCGDASVEAVYVATPNHVHADAFIRLLEAGKHVLVEKPLATSSEDADRMAAAAAASDRIVGVAYDQRHHPAHRRVRELIESGGVGTVTQIRILYSCWLPPRWTPDGVSMDNWRIDLARAGGGAVIDLLPHGLDLCSFLLGDAAIESIRVELQRAVHPYDAAAGPPVDDGGVTMLGISRGVLASIHNSYACPDALPRRLLEVYGSGGLIRAVNTMGQTAGGEVELIDASGRVSDVCFGPEGPFDCQFEWWSRQLIATRGARLPPGIPRFAAEAHRFQMMMDAIEAAKLRE